MTKFFMIPIALAAIAPPALAETTQGNPFSFKADGLKFDVVRVDTPEGAILTGIDSSHKRFRLEVVGRRVTGFYGDGPVAYTIPAPIAPQQRLALK